MKIAIITDSSCNLPKEYINTNENIAVMPLSISVDNTQYRDQIDITAKEIYDQLDNHDVKSSLPSVGDLHVKIKEIIESGYDHILMITISSGLSGTFNSFRLAAKEYSDINITLYDSKTLGMGLGYLVMEAEKLIKDDKSISEIINHLDKVRYEELAALYTIDTLKYLRKGGRIGKVEGTIGDILNVKPIISVNDEGVYYTVSKTIGKHRAIVKMRKHLKDRFQDKLVNLTVHYGNDINKAKLLLEKLEKELNVKTSILSELTPVLGIHTGPGLIAVIAHTV